MLYRANRKLLLFFLYLFFSHAVFAISSNIQFDKISAENGLSSRTIYCIYRDSRGYLWIGTENGLNRYDGYEFKIYSHDFQDKNSISGNWITSIAEDKNANLWIGVWDGGLNFFERSTEKFYYYTSHPDDTTSISSNVVWTVYIDKEQQVWAGTINSGLNVLDIKTQKFKRFSHNSLDKHSISSNNISSIIEDSYHNLWVGTKDSGLNLLNRQSNNFTTFIHKAENNNSLVSNNINTIYEDSEHNLWIGTADKGILVLNTKYKTIYNIEGFNNNVRCFYQNNNMMWIGTDGNGIHSFDLITNKFLDITKNDPNLINSKVIFSINGDINGPVWIGTFRDGLYVYDNKKYKFHPLYKSSDLDYPVMSLYENIKGILWIGTDGGGLYRYDTHTNQFTSYKHDILNNSSIGGNVVKSVFEDSYGNIWAGINNSGLDMFSPNEKRFVHYRHDPSNPNSLCKKNVWDILEDSKRNLWIASLSDGLCLFDRNKKSFKHYRADGYSNSLCSNNIYKIIEDVKRNGLWIGTVGGLSFFEPEKEKFTNYYFGRDSISGICNFHVLYLDSNKTLWIGTKSNGIILFLPEKGETFTFTIKDGLSSNSVLGILEDNNHNIWISTTMGISKFDPVRKKFTNYTTRDGLRSNEFIENATFKRKNGDLIFGNFKGFEVVHPEGVENNNKIPNILISKLLIFNKEVYPGTKDSPLKKVISESSEITLKYYQNIITFEFTALNFTNPEKNQYAYILEGFDNDWNYCGSKRSATFTNLHPGDYILKIKACNNDGIWNTKGVNLTIHILPPWWKTLWFRIIFLSSFVLSVLSWLNYKTRRIRRQKLKLEMLVKKRTLELALEKEKVEKQRDEIKEMSERVHQIDEEKLNFFTNISHEIRTPLTLIIGPLEKLNNNSSFENIDTKKQISRILNNSLILKRLINQILDFRKIESKVYPLKASKFDIIKILEEAMLAFQDSAAEKEINFSFEKDIDSLEVWIDYEKFDKIIFNLLSNAFKFTPTGGKITIQISVQDSESNNKEDNIPDKYLLISVRDTGIGIPKDQLNSIFDKFHQVNKTNNTEGSGIGLTIAKSLVELHHGTISVESKEGIGSCFTVTLPLGNKHLLPDEMVHYKPYLVQSDNNINIIKENHVEIEKHIGIKSKFPKMLLIEDNNDLRHFIKESFEDQYQILEACNGIEGFEKAKKIFPNIIISDIMMPRMNGLELCKKLKNDIDTSHIPVILLTARVMHEHKLEGLETGADDFIIKPFNHEELRIRISNLVKSRNLLREKFSRSLVLQPAEITLTSNDEKFLKKAIEIVEKNMSDSNFDVAEFITEIGISRAVAYVKFKELTGQSIGDFIRTLRLKRAAQLLTQNNASVSEISYMAGFSSPSHFGMCFKKLFGESPNSYALKYYNK